MSPRFNLDDYEPVDARIERFYQEHPDGRIVTWVEWHDPDMSKLVFGAKVYRAGEDTAWATGFAFEILGSTPVNKTSHVENAETSAIGRALANAGYATKGRRPSREEMTKTLSRIEAKPELPPSPLSSEEQNERIITLGKRLKALVGDDAAAQAYRNERAAAGPVGTLTAEMAARIITGLELRLSLAEKASAASPLAADGATEEPGAGSGGASEPPAAPPISKKQRDRLTKRREQLFQFTGSDEEWYSIMSELGAETIDGLDGARAREAEHLANEAIKRTEFIVPPKLTGKPS